MVESGRSEVRDVLRDYESAMYAVTAQIKADLERARVVVRDATARLHTSFRSLHAATAAHRDALQAVTAAFGDADGNGTGFAASSEALMRQFVDEIVRVSRDSMRMIGQVTELSGKVDDITACADAIDRLARETRFIAFNARIETHRAGEAGRTFKVVADEVKRLANASSTLSSQIRLSVGACRVELDAANKTATGLASHDMGRAVESHRGLALAISKLDEVNRHLDHMLETITANVSEAVRAMQFEEMVSQILQVTIVRVEKIGELSVRAVNVIERGHNGDRVGPLREIVENVRALGAHVPVQQPSMDTGSVELF